MLNPFDKLGYCFYINLDKRKNRNDLMQAELQKYNIVAERFSGIEDEHPNSGCTLSHIKILQLAKERKLDSVVIMEDDVKFHNELPIVCDLLSDFISKNSWDIIYLYFSEKSTFLGSDVSLSDKYKISRIDGVPGTHCYIVNHTAYDVIIEKAMEKKHKCAYDKILQTRTPSLIKFSISPLVAVQRNGLVSDISGKIRKYEPKFI